MSKELFLRKLKWLADLYPGFKLESSRATAYWSYLSSLPWADISKAMSKCPTEYKFFPSANEIKNLADSTMKQRKLIESTNETKQAPRLTGKTKGLPPDNPLEQLAIEWENTTGPVSDKEAKRRLMKLYDMIDEKAKERAITRAKERDKIAREIDERVRARDARARKRKVATI